VPAHLSVTAFLSIRKQAPPFVDLQKNITGLYSIICSAVMPSFTQTEQTCTAHTSPRTVWLALCLGTCTAHPSPGTVWLAPCLGTCTAHPSPGTVWLALYQFSRNSTARTSSCIMRAQFTAQVRKWHVVKKAVAQISSYCVQNTGCTAVEHPAAHSC
jgi:hypothetical protein